MLDLSVHDESGSAPDARLEIEPGRVSFSSVLGCPEPSLDAPAAHSAPTNPLHSDMFWRRAHRWSCRTPRLPVHSSLESIDEQRLLVIDLMLERGRYARRMT